MNESKGYIALETFHIDTRTQETIKFYQNDKVLLDPRIPTYKTVEGKIGHAVTLNVYLKGMYYTNMYKIVWLRPYQDNKGNINEVVIIQDDEKYKDARTASLIIKNVNSKDGGTYVLRVYNMLNKSLVGDIAIKVII